MNLIRREKKKIISQQQQILLAVPVTASTMDSSPAGIPFLHKMSTRKSAAAMAAVDHGEGCERHSKRYAILLDKGYISVEQLVW